MDKNDTGLRSWLYLVLAIVMIVTLFCLTGCQYILPKTTAIVDQSGMGWSLFLSSVVEDTVDWVVFIVRMVLG